MPEEVFTEPEPNVIASSEGFTIEVLGRTGMRYAQGGRSLSINSEMLAAPHGIVMSPNSMKRWEPDAEAVSPEERERVTANIQRAFAACGHELQVAEPFDWDSVAMRPPEERDRKRRAYEVGISRADYEAGSATEPPDPQAP